MRRKRSDGLHILVDVYRGPIDLISEAKALNSTSASKDGMSLNFAAKTSETVNGWTEWVDVLLLWLRSS